MHDLIKAEDDPTKYFIVFIGPGSLCLFKILILMAAANLLIQKNTTSRAALIDVSIFKDILN